MEGMEDVVGRGTIDVKVESKVKDAGPEFELSARQQRLAPLLTLAQT
jgi:hypothetical protein